MKFVCLLLLVPTVLSAQTVTVDSVYRSGQTSRALGRTTIPAAPVDSFRFRWQVCVQFDQLEWKCSATRATGYTKLPPPPAVDSVIVLTR